jgi:hypothetical protein
MTLDTALGLAGVILGMIGVIATIVATAWAIRDSRMQRSEREKAVIAAWKTVEHVYGVLIGIKPSVASQGDVTIAAINEALDAINVQRAALERL